MRYNLRHRGTIEYPIRERGKGDSRVQEAWELLEENVPMNIEHLSGRELIAAREQYGEVTARIVMGFRQDLEPKMRIRHTPHLRGVPGKEQVFNIRYVQPDKSISMHTTVLVDAGVNQG